MVKSLFMLYLVVAMVLVHFGVFFYFAQKFNDERQVNDFRNNL